jgi:hypothetical protein
LQFLHFAVLLLIAKSRYPRLTPKEYWCLAF